MASDLRPTRATCQTPRSSAAASLQEGLGEGGAWLLEAQAVPLATGSTGGISRLVRQARPAGCRRIDRRAEMRSGRRCGAVQTSHVAPRGAEGGRRMAARLAVTPRRRDPARWPPVPSSRPRARGGRPARASTDRRRALANHPRRARSRPIHRLPPVFSTPAGWPRWPPTRPERP